MTKGDKIEMGIFAVFTVNNSKNDEGDKSEKSYKIEIAFQKLSLITTM